MNTSQKLTLLVFGIVSLPTLAATFKLDASGQEALYRTELPKAVYQYSRDENLADLTIHNAYGEQVPYALLPYETLHPLNTAIGDTKPLSVYPIHEYQLQDASELNIMIEGTAKHRSNSAINLKMNTPVKDTKNIYLVDAGKEHPALQALSVEWDGGEDSLLSLEILTSDDLKTWANAGHAMLLKTTAGGSTLLQNSITLNQPTEARYLQIRPSDNDALILTKVNAEYHNTQALTPNILWQPLALLNRERNAKTGEINIDFESAGRYAVSHLRVTLPETNTITQVKVFARKSANDHWQYIRTTSLYHMSSHGKTYTNPDIDLSPTTARYWRLQFNQANGGIGSDNPDLTAGWLPETAVWNARGKAPFTFQVGNNPDIVNHVTINSLISDNDSTPELKLKKLQQLPKAVVIEASLSADPSQPVNAWVSPPNYKHWLLWGGLLTGVLLLAGMAYSLIRSRDSK